MSEYISREAALQFVFDACAECMDACEEFDGIYADCNQCMLEGVKLKLRDLPAADVRPVVRGKWEYNPGDNIPYCSECMMPQDSECNFCPNCGADMRQAGDENV